MRNTREREREREREERRPMYMKCMQHVELTTMTIYI